MNKDTISFKGDRNKWIDFVAKVKKDKKEIWFVLEPFLEKYTNDPSS